VSANASRAPSRAATLTPLSTTDVVMVCSFDRFWEQPKR
jgi:hypothetical protein